MKNIVKIKRALISISDKSFLKEILSILNKYNVEIISSSGTYKKIRGFGFKSTKISDFTGCNEMLGGRIKTLHHKIHAGILNNRNNKSDKLDLQKYNLEEIDLVIVNFYPFGSTIKKRGNNLNNIIENIDIGGPTLARAAAKNFNDVLVISDPKYYKNAIKEIDYYKGSTSLSFRKWMAANSFNKIANYDSIISNYLNDKFNINFPNEKTFSGNLIEKLRYGENPHQEAAIYSVYNDLGVKQLHGKKLSFNNYNDIFSTLLISESFQKGVGTVILKHTNPCGASNQKDKLKSFESALACDPISAFGGIVLFNFKINEKLAKKVNKFFFEIIIANGFDKNALKIFKKKKNLRLIDKATFKIPENYIPTFHRGTFLYQKLDNLIFNKKNFKVVSNRKPNKKQFDDLIFAFNMCKHVKSNAVVLVKDKSVIGIGAGQPSRIDSCNLAVEKARKFKTKDLLNCVAASDAFFPFTDGVEKLIQAGVSVIIQPSGSKRDGEIIKLANKTNITLVFSRTRHFKH